ncbi:RagB/SusD family nutrient uptake outer membrane protein [Mangrovibacterium sp.]|uniref:RagB/SusD family nutrient uptake outer membrane protein n=1 Tax=Mangrovibacterium sp. TaxID=1961364 RepID=UPI003565D0C9
MTINKYIKGFGFMLFLSGFFLTGCEDYLDQEPQDEVTESVYFQTAEQFEYASNYFYKRIAFEDGDETSDLSNNLTYDWGYGQGTVSTAETDDIWDNNYTYLRYVNQLIEKADEYPGEYSEIEEYVGAAYFFRAWHHWKLLRRFGGVPIVTRSLDVSSEEVWGPRNSRYEVVSQMLEDLDVAISYLPSQSAIADADYGKVSIEAARAFKARVCLFEATYEKYADLSYLDGDGTNTGAGSAKPDDYPSITEMLTEAKSQASAVMNAGIFELWDHQDDMGAAYGDEFSEDYNKDHLFYLFNLEDAQSNPAGLTKASNKEFIFQTIYDYTYAKINENLTHSKPHCPSRKLMDMYLCSDGLPVQHSPLFQGYSLMVDEFENRDLRLEGLVTEPLKEYWGWGGSTNGGGAQYGIAFDDAGTGYDYRYVPNLTSPSNSRNLGYQGRKFTTEHISRETKEESYNYPLIRYAEVLLIYAEATCELGNGSISDADLAKSINLIRKRSGVADLTNSIVTSYNDLTMLGEIRRERAIELFGEDFRFDDLKRWGIAVEELGFNICVTYIQYNGTSCEFETAVDPKSTSGALIYDESVWTYGLTTEEEVPSTYAGIASTKPGALIICPASDRMFKTKHYLDAIPTDEINLNPELLQNPGW